MTTLPCKGSLIFFVFIVSWLCFSGNSVAALIQSYDSSGKPLLLEEEIAENPEFSTQQMVNAFERGELTGAAFISHKLLSIQPDNQPAIAIQAIFSASQDSIDKVLGFLKRLDKSDKSQSYALVIEAMIKQRAKKYHEALALCEKAIVMEEDQAFFWNVRGRIYSELNKTDAAAASFKKALEIAPSFQPAYTNLASVLFLQGHYNEAAEQFRAALTTNSQNQSAHLGLGLVYEASGKYQEALLEFSTALQLKPQDLLSLQKIVEMQLRTGLFEEAIKNARELLPTNKNVALLLIAEADLYLGHYKKCQSSLRELPIDNIARLYLEGLYFIAQSNHLKALERMTTVLAINKNHFGAFSARLVVQFYLDQEWPSGTLGAENWNEKVFTFITFLQGNRAASVGDWEEASRYWHESSGIIGGFSCDGLQVKEFQELMQSTEMKSLSLGMLYYFKRLNQLAADEFTKILNHNPESLWANYWLAQTLLQQGNRTLAIEHMMVAITGAPNFYIALYGLGELLYQEKQPDNALVYYLRALEVKKDLGLLIKTGLLFEKQELYGKAERQYNTIVTDFPELFLGYNQLAWLYASQGIELDKAQRFAEKANQLQPGNASIMDTLAWIYFQQEKHQKALSYAIKAQRQCHSVGGGTQRRSEDSFTKNVG